MYAEQLKFDNMWPIKAFNFFEYCLLLGIEPFGYITKAETDLY